MRRTHAMMPLTIQEEEVRSMLIEERLPFESHHVFDLKSRGRMSVDFMVFFGNGIVIECTRCSTRRGRALSELRRRSAFIDYRFDLLKGSFPKLACGAFVEAPNEKHETLSRELNLILKDADFVATSSEELDGALSRLREVGSK
jgi:hypothetical protein